MGARFRIAGPSGQGGPMAAFTLKEMDTEIPAGKAKTRGYAMAGFDIAEYF